MPYPWESELPALADKSDQEAADAINALTVPSPPVLTFGSFRTLASLLSQAEYNALRSALKAAADAETAAGETLIADMIGMLQTPGDENGNGGGLDFADPTFVAMVGQLATAANVPDVPGKIAAHVAGRQNPPTKKYPEPPIIWPHHIAAARRGEL